MFNLNTAKKRLAYRQAMLKPDAVVDPRSTDYAAVYTYEYLFSGQQRFSAKGFIGKAGKPFFNYYFNDENKREEYILWFFDVQKATHDLRREKQLARKSFSHTLEIGQLMHGSWGYDQTNCEFWQVTKVISNKTVQLCKVKGSTVPGSEGFMSENLRPIKDEVYGEPVTCRVQTGNRCKINDHCYVSPCSETDSFYNSWYA